MSLAVFECPLCGTRREALKGSEVHHPCPKKKAGKGRDRFVRLVRVEEAA